MRRLLIGVALGMLVVGCSASTKRTERTPSGDLVYQLEGMLHHEFGSAPPFVSGDGQEEDFSCAGDCSPLSTYTAYNYVFAEHTDSTLHATTKQLGAGASFVMGPCCCA